MHRAPAYVAVLAVVAVCTAACSSSPAAPSAAVQTTSVASLTAAGSQSTVLTADQVILKFKTAKLPVGSILEFTAATDPNHLLGRPNGYTSKTSWTDTRISAGQANDDTAGSVDLGGSVEIFASAADSQAREAYIQSELKANPMLGTEYDFVVGDALIRVSEVLTPTQAQAYDTAAQG